MSDKCIDNGGNTARGYKSVWNGGNRTTAHRKVCADTHNLDLNDASWIARHTCGNPRCINPDHIVPGTYEDNARDRAEHGNTAVGERHGRWNGGWRVRA